MRVQCVALPLLVVIANLDLEQSLKWPLCHLNQAFSLKWLTFSAQNLQYSSPFIRQEVYHVNWTSAIPKDDQILRS